MKRIIFSLLSVVMLVMMMLPADIVVARGRGEWGPTAINETAESLVADFVFDLPACLSCSGIIFTDKSSGGVQPYKYAWDFGDGSNSTQQNPRHRYANAGNYTVTLTVIDRAGDLASKSETVTLNSAPKTKNVELDSGVLVLPTTSLLLMSAASSGPNSGGTFADDSSVGTVAWSNPSNAQTQNDVYATASLTQFSRTSHYLKATNFGFSISSNATIQGIVVEVDRYESGGSPRVTDNSIKLVKGGVISGDDKSTGASWPNSDSDTYQSYGGSSDLWGLNWTPADINSSNFGVVISAIKDSSNHDRTAYVDHIRIKVYYAVTQPPPSNPPYLKAGKSASPGPCCGEATVTLTVTGAGEPLQERLPVDVILILDRSGSMAGSKMNAAKQAAKDFVDLLDSSQDRVGLVSYSGDGGSRYGDSTLDEPLTNNFGDVKDAIDDMVAYGATCIACGLQLANNEFNLNGRDDAVRVEILLTDGIPNRPNGNGRDFNEADAQLSRDLADAFYDMDMGGTLYTIGLGNPPEISHYFLDDKPAGEHDYNPGDPAGHPYNHDGLAFIGGGDYYHAPTPTDLEFMFEEISEKITSIAGTNVWVTEVLPSGVHYVDGSAVPAPDSIVGQTLTWNLGSISIDDDPKTITFNVTFDTPGYQLVDEYPDTRVDYTNYQGEPACAVFPETHVRVLQPVADAGDYKTICSSESTDLDGSDSEILGGCDDDGGHIEYQWSIKDGAVIQSWSTDPTVTVSPTVTTTYTLEVRCSSLPDCTDSDDVTVTLCEEPNCHITASPDTTVCAGNNVTLTEDGGDAVSWLWTTAETSQSITVSASGTYGVTITDANGCEKYCEIEITVNELPACHITASPDTTVCAGNNITLTEDGGDAVSWLWTTAETSQSITVSASGTYGVTITDANGCEKYCEIEITVNELPACHITASPDTTVCAGNNITLIEDGGDAVSWLWTTAETSQSITVSASGTYGVTITDANGCEKYCEIEITVNELPACHITALPDTTVCAGNNVTLIEDGGDAVSWDWTTGETTSSIVVSASGTYGVTITDANGCEKYCEIEITVNELPACHITASPDTTVCAGNNVTLTEDGGDAVSWLWTTAETSQSITVSASGTYGVTITNANGCEKYCEIEITVNECAGPLLTITKSDSPDPVEPGGTLTYAITVNNTGSANATGVTIVDDYDETVLTIVNAGGGIDDGDTITWDGGIIIPTGGSFSCNIIATVIPTATRGSTFYNTANVTCAEGVSASITIGTMIARVPVTPAGGGGVGCPFTKYLTVDWEGNNTTKPLYSNNKLAVDLLGPSTDGSHSLLLEQGTRAPIVGGKTHYRIVIRELEEIPPVPENTVALVAVNITPAGAVFDRDIFLTLGLDELQLPENALNVTMAYYDDVNGVWVELKSETGGPNGVAELTLSAPINHFSIFGVLAELAPTPTPPAHFMASGLSIVPSVEKTTFVTKTGESVTITANVANDGGQEGTYIVELKLNGETVDTRTVTLAAGQGQPVSFTRSGLDYGQYEVDVAGLTGDFTTSRTITWWLIIVIIAAIGLIIWGVVWGRRRRKAQQAA